MPETPSFERYNAEKHAEMKAIEGVVNVVSGNDIDIIVLRKQTGHIQFWIDEVKDKLIKIWVNVEQVAFMYEGATSILNPKPTANGGAGTLLSFAQVGIEALKELRIIQWGTLDSIIPPSLMSKPTYNATDIITMNRHLQALNVDPADIRVGAKFLITTESGSQYVLTVNEEGLFEIKNDEINLKKPNMIWATFIEFNSTRRLVGWKSNTSPVLTMVKL